MKVLFVFTIFNLIVYLSAFSQPQLTDSDNFNAICKETAPNYNNHLFVSTYNDSLIIKGAFVDQCCAQFSLQVSEANDDTIAVVFKDTALAQCNCICNYDIWINAGKHFENTTHVNFNGNTYDIMAKDYKPLVQAKKKWNVLFAVPGLEFSHPSFIEYSIDSNEGHYFCWNGKSYLKVEVNQKLNNGIHTDSLPKYIREENGKVYLLDSTDLAFDGCNESLLYDFTLKPGDSVYVGYDSTLFYVSHTGYNELWQRRYLYLNDNIDIYYANNLLPVPEAIWVEGIGDLRGLFESSRSVLIDGIKSVLTCFWSDDSLVYQDQKYPDCGDRPPYQFFIEKGKKWTYVEQCLYPYKTYSRFEETMDSSEVDDQTYTIRYYPDKNNANVYFQETDRRVYYRQNDAYYLIYDFTLNAGDSVQVGLNQYTYLHVDSVKYIEYADNIPRKTIYLTDYPNLSGNKTGIWVEGLGDPFNPLFYWQPIPTNGCVPDFACCSLRDQLIYQNPAYPNCGVGLSFDPNKYRPVSIYPNPSDGNITIENYEFVRDVEYAVYTLSGSLLLKGPARHKLRLHIEPGMYLFKLTQNNVDILTRKIAISK